MKHLGTDQPFDDALEDLRISGSVLLNERYAPPWAIDVPVEQQLRSALSTSPEQRVVPFHLVRSGCFELHYAGLPPQRIDTNEVAICPSGAAHRMSLGEGAAPQSLDDILRLRQSRDAPADNPGTELICGAIRLRSAPLNPLLAALPTVLKVRTAGPGVNPLLAHAVAMLAIEVAKGASSFVTSRLLEVFFAEAIRAYRQHQGATQSGWFKALDDPKIGHAIGRIHQHPGAAWSVPTLAQTVSLSPSRFAARFRQLTGQSAMSYVARWRMTVACQRLCGTGIALSEVAAEVGYQDIAAFGRAFKSLVGQSPARWRRESA